MLLNFFSNLFAFCSATFNKAAKVAPYQHHNTLSEKDFQKFYILAMVQLFL